MDEKQAERVIKRGAELGKRFLMMALEEGYEMAEIYAACGIMAENIEKTAQLFDILGPEKFGELAEMIMKNEQEKLIDEAEEALRDGE